MAMGKRETISIKDHHPSWYTGLNLQGAHKLIKTTLSLKKLWGRGVNREGGHEEDYYFI